MAKANPSYRQLMGTTHGEIIQQQLLPHVAAYQQSHPHQPIHMMAWGQTTQPLSPVVIQAMQKKADLLGDADTYTSYEDVVGNAELRQAICSHFYQQRGIHRRPSEIFISDGAQSATTTLLELFDSNDTVAVQNPVYPSYVEAIALSGRNHYVPLDCHEHNGFMPTMPEQNVDIIYLCYPNNPTGAAAKVANLQSIVDYARTHQAVIIFDSVYSEFVRTPNVPRSIYEIEGAESCAIEVGSFSKIANFTGLRVGWCVIPSTLTVENSTPDELRRMWKIRHAVKFWGPANVAQHGAIAALTPNGWEDCIKTIRYYMTNAQQLKAGLQAKGIVCFGGTDNPYLWLKCPVGMTSQQFFDDLLTQTGIVGIPGHLYGSAGEGYVRLSTFGHRETVARAIASLELYE